MSGFTAAFCGTPFMVSDHERRLSGHGKPTSFVKMCKGRGGMPAPLNEMTAPHAPVHHSRKIFILGTLHHRILRNLGHAEPHGLAF
jgi:hypothetical protein